VTNVTEFRYAFQFTIIPILDAQKEIETQADNTKEGKYINSGIINGMEYKEATATLVQSLEERGIGVHNSVCAMPYLAVSVIGASQYQYILKMVYHI
jgi:hypothetical protein